jgi:hypothetical protein
MKQEMKTRNSTNECLMPQMPIIQRGRKIVRSIPFLGVIALFK